MLNVKRIIIIIVAILVLAFVVTISAKAIKFGGSSGSLTGDGNNLNTISGSMLDEIKEKYDNKKVSATEVRTSIKRYYNDKTVAIYLVDCMEGKTKYGETSNISKLKFGSSSYGENNPSTALLPLLCSPAYIESSYVKAKGQGEKLERVEVSKANLKSAMLRPAMKKCEDTVGTSGMFKAVLIVNDGSQIMGVLFQRYK